MEADGQRQAETVPEAKSDLDKLADLLVETALKNGYDVTQVRRMVQDGGVSMDSACAEVTVRVRTGSRYFR